MAVDDPEMAEYRSHMEEIEVPTEAVQEEIQHSAHESREQWIFGVALSSALLAAFAAVTALMAGHHANEAMIEQIHSSNHWAFFQAKGVKQAVLSSKVELLKALGKTEDLRDLEKIAEYKKDQAEIKATAEEKQHASEAHMGHHVILARGVTLFQVAIAVAAISVLTRRKRFWYVSMGFGVVGLFFLIQGLL